MIHKLLESSGYIVNDLQATYLQTPLVSGYFFVYIKLPEALTKLLSDHTYAESVLIRNVRSTDLPNIAFQNETREHGRGLRSTIPIGEEISNDITIRFQETTEFEIQTILSIWQSCILNPVTYRPLIKKSLGQSWLELFKTTITIYVLPQNFLNNPENLIIFKMYGSHIDQLSYADNQPDITQNNIVTITASFKFDRFVPLTKSTATLYGMEQTFMTSVHMLYNSLKDLKDDAYATLLRLFDDLNQRLQNDIAEFQEDKH